MELMTHRSATRPASGLGVGGLVILVLVACLPLTATGQEAEPANDLQGILEAMPSGLTAPNRYAVVIGVGAQKDRRISSLPACARDARDMHELLIDPQVGMFPAENVTLLVDEDVTSRNVMQALERLARQARSEDLVIVFFSGHGTVDAQKRSYWVMYDTETASVYSTALAETVVSELLNNIQSNRLVTLVDTCFAAATANVGDMKAMVNLGEVYPQFSGTGRVLIAASKGDQPSVVITDRRHPGYGYSAFAWYVIQGLRGAADDESSTRDGIVTVDELWNYVKDRTERVSRRSGGAQQPQLKGQLGSRFLLTVNAPVLREQDEHLQRRVGTLRTLFIDRQINALQCEEGLDLLPRAPQDMTREQLRRRVIYTALADGEVAPKFLTALLHSPVDVEAGPTVPAIAARPNGSPRPTPDTTPARPTSPAQPAPVGSNTADAWGAAMRQRTGQPAPAVTPAPAETPAQAQTPARPAPPAQPAPAGSSTADAWSAAMRQRTGQPAPAVARAPAETPAETRAPARPQTPPAPSVRDQVIEGWTQQVRKRL